MSHQNYYLDFTVGTFVVHADRVLLCHHRNMNLWLPPGGHIEPGELPTEAAIRETLEETGLAVQLIGLSDDIYPIATRPNPDIDKFTQVLRPRFMDVHPIRGEHKHLCMYYFAQLAEGVSPDSLVLDKEEHIAFTWAAANDINHFAPITEATRCYALEALLFFEDPK